MCFDLVSGGRNGYGAKLCNIFSTKFIVETSCKEYRKSFKQVTDIFPHLSLTRLSFPGFLPGMWSCNVRYSLAHSILGAEIAVQQCDIRYAYLNFAMST